VEHITIQASDGQFSVAELTRLARAIEKVHPLVEASAVVDAAPEDTRRSEHVSAVWLWTCWAEPAPNRANDAMKVTIGWARRQASRSQQPQRVVMLGADGTLLQALDLLWPARQLVDPPSSFRPPPPSRDPRRASDKRASGKH
jgi:hypothetical protein